MKKDLIGLMAALTDFQKDKRRKIMRKNLILMMTSTIFFALGSTAAAQITITIPKFPKIKKESPQKQPATPDNQVPNQPSQQTETEEEPYVQQDGRIMLFISEIVLTRKEIETYTPQTRTAFVSHGNEEWLWRAISPSQRKEFFDKWQSKMSPKDKSLFETELETIKSLATTKIQLRVPNPKNFTFRNPVEERMMKTRLEDITGLVVHKIGLQHNQWQIEKNEFGLPISRYKHGLIWGRNPNKDDAYCRFYYVNIVQDYAGAGTYGATYAALVDTELAACPLGK